MLGLVHALLLWSDHARQVGKRPTRLSMLLLALSVLAWGLVHQSQSVSAQQLFTILLAVGYAYYQRSFWPLTLTPITLSTTVEFHAWVDGLLQTAHAEYAESSSANPHRRYNRSMAGCLRSCGS